MLKSKAKAPQNLNTGNIIVLKHQSYSLAASCDDCNNGTVILFTEEVRNLVEKVPFACLHQHHPAKHQHQ